MIPPALAYRIEQHASSRVGSWPLRHKLDSYGNFLETEIGEIYSLHEIEKVNEQLSMNFPYEGPNEFAVAPGAIPDPKDFSSIVNFAIAGDGSPFCLDFRGGPEPSVIWWDDTYWRRVAPNAASFLALFELSEPSS